MYRVLECLQWLSLLRILKMLLFYIHNFVQGRHRYEDWQEKSQSSIFKVSYLSRAKEAFGTSRWDMLAVVRKAFQLALWNKGENLSLLQFPGVLDRLCNFEGFISTFSKASILPCYYLLIRSLCRPSLKKAMYSKTREVTSITFSLVLGRQAGSWIYVKKMWDGTCETVIAVLVQKVDSTSYKEVPLLQSSCVEIGGGWGRVGFFFW